VLATPAWRATADELVTRAVAAQDPAGYWPEHQGPTPSYNLVYTYALGLYHLQGGAVAVLPALERALRFHELFTYPDGTLVETVDGRVKYHDHLNPAVAGFALLPRGRRYVEAIVQRALERGERWSAPHFAQLLRYWDTFPAGDAPSVFEQDHVVAELARALVVKDQDWYACLSGFTCPPVESRWGQDRQSFISVWRRAAGLIIGGGNSKNQPEWSTFDITTSDGRRCFVPAAGAVDPDTRTLTLNCEGRRLQVQLAALDARTLTLRLTAEGRAGDRLATHLPVRVRPGAPFALDGEHVASEEPLSLVAAAGSHQLRQGHWQLAWTGGYTFMWPSFPFNPYAKDGRSDASRPDGKPDLGAAVAILTLPLVPGEPRDVCIAHS
ncbi:MAG TPA: hypothetical protein VFU72_09885, partial [Nitrolancea sp.]|nr:hypothetical protein [Nitrolancea sp.]